MGRSPSVCIVGISTAILLAWPSAASAQRPSEPGAEAREAFFAGQAAYEAGRFAEAVEHFGRAYELTNDPDVLFNLANSYDRLRRDREALDAYRRYLELRPEGEERAQIEARIAAIAAIVEQGEHEPARSGAEQAEPERTAPEQAEPRAEVLARAISAEPQSEPNVGAWSLVAGGGAAVIAGIVLLALSQADIDQVAVATRWADAQDAYERAPALSTAGGVCLGVGIAALAGGAVWLVAEGAF